MGSFVYDDIADEETIGGTWRVLWYWFKIHLLGNSGSGADAKLRSAKDPVSKDPVRIEREPISIVAFKTMRVGTSKCIAFNARKSQVSTEQSDEYTRQTKNLEKKIGRGFLRQKL